MEWRVVLKRVFRKAVTLCIVVIVTFLLAEVSFRIYNGFRPSPIFYDDSYNRFRGKPLGPDYDTKLNSGGFKDVEFTTQKDPGVCRIVAIGDSFPFGVVPYRYNYLTLLEKQLNRPTRRFEVINMGIPGTCPHDYLSLLLREGLALKPDMVILNFFMGNDFIDNPSPRRWYAYSQVVTFFKYLFTLPKIQDGRLFHKSPVYRDEKPTMDERTFLKVEVDRSRIFRRDRRDCFFRELAGVLKSIKTIKNNCDRRGIRLLVVMIPDEIQVDPLLQKKVMEKQKMPEALFDFSFPNRSFRKELAARHIDFIDLLDVFLKASTSRRLYKPRDTHWNIAGNRLAADSLSGFFSHRK